MVWKVHFYVIGESFMHLFAYLAILTYGGILAAFMNIIKFECIFPLSISNTHIKYHWHSDITLYHIELLLTGELWSYKSMVNKLWLPYST